MNKDKIIKDLKERNKKLSNQYRLRDIRCVHLEQEIDRLNNIINELEKDLKNKIEEDRLNILSNPHWLYCLDKLKELKENK